MLLKIVITGFSDSLRWATIEKFEFLPKFRLDAESSGVAPGPGTIPFEKNSTRYVPRAAVRVLTFPGTALSIANLLFT
jgi:hypothetical protein